MRSTIGRKVAPAFVARVVKDVLHVERDEEEDAEHRERDEHRHDVRAGEGADPEERQVEHRQALPAARARRTRRAGRLRAAKRPRISGDVQPWPVPLDERITEREEEPDRGDKAREVDALLGRGVARLADHELRDDDRERADRDVDEEDPVPVDVLRDQATAERPDRQRQRRDAGPDPDRRSALLAAGRSRR